MNAFPVIEAAVAGIIVREPTAEVLVLKRKANPRDPWSGHYSLPGGRRDRSDGSLLDTCLRETFEECGVLLSPDRMIKQYPVRAAGNALDRPVPVTTFLFELDEQPPIRLQTNEISCHEWLDLNYAADEENIIRRPMSPRFPGRLFPCLPAGAGFVWGFTYETLRMIIADRYSRAAGAALPEALAGTKSA
jgi:8-oxo-dGTP pyrophosphatase MutT (NUDIX family)